MNIHVAAVMLMALGVASVGARGQAGSLTRTSAPAVLVGAQVESLSGLSPDEIVAFRYVGGWVQVPVQVDERKYVDFGVVYRLPPIGLGVIAYADPTTDTGLDSDPAFDEDDELVFLADDVGGRAPFDAALPAGVVGGSGVEVRISDPLDGGVGYAYLFPTDGTLTPDAGFDYVTYTFDLLAGDYLTHYNTDAGPNPEDSEAFSAFYRTRFSDRWIRDELNILAGEATGVDILDRHKAMFGPGNCVRTEDTFSAGEGAFFTNKDGPVRGIRSYIGANSGPFTQREHIFYERRQDIVTNLRVHAIPGVMDLYDYSPEAAGMIYYNDLNQGGVAVDGFPDTVAPGPIVWEMVTGEQGSVIVAHRLVTDIDPFTYTSFYSDDATPPNTQCTGDAFEYATTGLWINHSIPNTDPYLGSFNTLATTRIVFYEPPDESVATAMARSQQASTPLSLSVGVHPRSRGDVNGDCRVDLSDYSALHGCFSGPQGCAAAGCGVFDWDDDCDVDIEDFMEFVSVFTGSVGGLPGCDR